MCLERNEFDVTPILIIDGAPQHKCQILLDSGVKIVSVPFKQTHVFQPADQWIIAMLRSLLLQGWSDWVEEVFANNDVQHAVSVIITNSAPQIRKKKFELFSATNWAAAVPDSARVTVFVLDVVDVVVTEIVFPALSPDAHVRDAGL